MNIFVLDHNPFVAARYHIDKHVVKMILELAQMLSTAHRVLDGQQYTELSESGRNIQRWKLANKEVDSILYKATHINHPCSIWVRNSSENYLWAYDMLRELCSEYTHRYGKIHKTADLLPLLVRMPVKIKHRKLTEFAQAMPDEYKKHDAIQAYRDYYCFDKAKKLPMIWSKRPVPHWYLHFLDSLQSS